MKCFRIKYVLILLLPLLMNQINFDELDKSPIGAYKGQTFISATLGFGMPFGDIIDAEQEYISNAQYQFPESDIIKEVVITHYSFLFSASAEYMPLDRIGARTSISSILISQRTVFGSEFKNENEFLYSGIALTVGPNFHLNVRKPWDLSLNPFLGYIFGTFNPSVVADKLYSNYKPERNASTNSFCYGLEFAFQYYYNSGIFVSTGFNWTAFAVELAKQLTGEGIDTRDFKEKTYLGGETSGSMHAATIFFSVGYAFKN